MDCSASITTPPQSIEASDRFGTKHTSSHGTVKLKWNKKARSVETEFLIVQSLGAQYEAASRQHQALQVVLGGNSADVDGIVYNLLTESDGVFPILYGERTKEQRQRDDVAAREAAERNQREVAEEERRDNLERERKREERKRKARELKSQQQK